VPPKKVEPVVLVSEKTGAEDRALVNQEDVQAAVEYAETEENDDLIKTYKYTLMIDILIFIVLIVCRHNDVTIIM